MKDTTKESLGKLLGIDMETPSGRFLLFTALVIGDIGDRAITTILLSEISDYFNWDYVHTRTMINVIQSVITMGLYVPPTIAYHFLDDHFEKRVPPKNG